MYTICMIQEILVLIDMLQFQSLYHRLIWSHLKEWNVVITANYNFRACTDMTLHRFQGKLVCAIRKGK